MQTAMTQKEFDAVMDKHEQYLSKRRAGDDLYGYYTPANFEGKDLSGIDMSGRDYSLATFTNCQLGVVELDGITDNPVTFVNCVIAEVNVTNSSAYFTRCAVISSFRVRDSEYATVCVVQSDLNGVHVKNCKFLSLRVRNSEVGYVSVIKSKGSGILFNSVGLTRFRIEDCKFNEMVFISCPNASGQIATGEAWPISFTKDVMTIGCQTHLIETWRKLSDSAIGTMDIGALKWWKEWKDTVFAVVDKSRNNYSATADQLDGFLTRERNFLSWDENRNRCELASNALESAINKPD